MVTNFLGQVLVTCFTIYKQDIEVGIFAALLNQESEEKSMSDPKDQNARSIMGNHIDQAIRNGDLRSHERARAIDLACINWVGQTGNGNAAETAIKAIKSGI